MKSRRTFVFISLFLGLFITLVLTFTIPQTILANGGSLYYVDKDAPGPTHNGTSWATAYTEVQSALAVAVSGDEIWVAEGIYYPDYDPGATGYTGYITTTFTLTDGVALYGGFTGTETNREQRDWENYITVLSGDIDRNDAADSNGVVTDTANIIGSNAYHVVSSSGVTDTAVLDGFTITAGQANGSYPHYRGGGMSNSYGSNPTLMNVTFSGNTAYSGGGMSNWNSSNPTLTNVTFSGNTADYGGGMYNSINKPTLTDVTFSGNTASWGGGMYNDQSNPILTNVTFIGNTATYGGGGGMLNYTGSNPSLTNVTFSGNTATYGGGMSNEYSSNPTLTNVTFSGNTAGLGGGMFNEYSSNPNLTNVTFSGNTASWYGGGMRNYDSSPTLTNVTFSGNTATYDGGGMFNEYSSSPTLTDVTFSGNTAEHGGGMVNSQSNPTMTNTILWGNTATISGNQIYNASGSIPIISYSDIQGSGGSSSWDLSLGTDGGGNIDSDPLFVDPDGADNIAGTADDDLRLRLPSPAIDAGDNTAVPTTVTTDLDGNPRFVDIPSITDTGNGTAPIVDMGAYERQKFLIYLPLALRSMP